MTTALIWLGAAAVAALVARRTALHLAVRAPLRRRNYRGLEVPTAVGIAVLLGFLAGVGFVSVLTLVAPESLTLAVAAAEAVPFAALVLGFGLLGLWDDLTGEGERGWRAHLDALRHGRATGGAVKIAGGVALALVVVAPRGEGFWWAFVNAAIVAAAANLFNLLDVRPGRSGKTFLLAGVAMLFVGGPPAPVLCAGIGAVAAFLPLDLRERAMLGDTGANGMGAVVGGAIVAVGSGTVRLVTLAVLVALHLVADKPGLSRMIAAVPPLRRLDRAGRVPE